MSASWESIFPEVVSAPQTNVINGGGDSPWALWEVAEDMWAEHRKAAADTGGDGETLSMSRWRLRPWAAVPSLSVSVSTRVWGAEKNSEMAGFKERVQTEDHLRKTCHHHHLCGYTFGFSTLIQLYLKGQPILSRDNIKSSTNPTYEQVVSDSNEEKSPSIVRTEEFKFWEEYM